MPDFLNKRNFFRSPYESGEVENEKNEHKDVFLSGLRGYRYGLQGLKDKVEGWTDED